MIHFCPAKTSFADNKRTWDTNYGKLHEKIKIHREHLSLLSITIKIPQCFVIAMIKVIRVIYIFLPGPKAFIHLHIRASVEDIFVTPICPKFAQLNNRSRSHWTSLLSASQYKRLITYRHRNFVNRVFRLVRMLPISPLVCCYFSCSDQY